MRGVRLSNGAQQQGTPAGWAQDRDSWTARPGIASAESNQISCSDGTDKKCKIDGRSKSSQRNPPRREKHLMRLKCDRVIGCKWEMNTKKVEEILFPCFPSYVQSSWGETVSIGNPTFTGWCCHVIELSALTCNPSLRISVTSIPIPHSNSNEGSDFRYLKIMLMLWFPRKRQWSEGFSSQLPLFRIF